MVPYTPQSLFLTFQNLYLITCGSALYGVKQISLNPYFLKTLGGVADRVSQKALYMSRNFLDDVALHLGNECKQ